MPDTWTEIASFPQPREAIGIASWGGKIFVFGGDWSGTAVQTTVLSYDPDTNVWTTKGAMPWGAASGMDAITRGDEIWAIEGNNSSTATRRRIHFYNPATDTWTGQSSEMTDPITSYMARGIQSIYELQDGRILCWEAFDFNTGSGGGWFEYFPATNTWARRTGDPDFRYGAASTVIGGKLHRGIGRTISSTINKSSIYDITTDTWTTFTPAQWGRVGQGATKLPTEDGKAHAISSETRDQNHDLWDGTVYSPAALAAYPLADGGEGLIECAGYLYGCGGNLFAGSTPRCFRYDNYYGDVGEGWGILT